MPHLARLLVAEGLTALPNLVDAVLLAGLSVAFSKECVGQLLMAESLCALQTNSRSPWGRRARLPTAA